jgi:hypothetical protein
MDLLIGLAVGLVAGWGLGIAVWAWRARDTTARRIREWRRDTLS